MTDKERQELAQQIISITDPLLTTIDGIVGVTIILVKKDADGRPVTAVGEAMRAEVEDPAAVRIMASEGFAKWLQAVEDAREAAARRNPN